MAISSSAAPKKRKRREKQYEFHTFAEQGCPINSTGPFRNNIRVFLRERAELEDCTVEGMTNWRTTLVLDQNRDLVVPLFTVEETTENSPRPVCVHCLCTGWGHHFVSKRRYHLIIPRDDEWDKPLEDGVFDSQTHLLHGLIHCNGFGHLLCINGIEGGSKYLRGREIMDLWDRICTNLQTRKITVEDESKKHSMDLRLLYGVAYEHAWFGRWGYKFCRGSFGVNEYKYDRAIQFHGSIALDQIICNFGAMKQCQEIKRIIRFYRDLSETQLITVRDLLRFMLALKSLAPAKRKFAIDSSVASSGSRPSTRTTKQAKPLLKEKDDGPREFSCAVAHSRWPKRRLEFTAKVIVDILKQNKSIKFGNGGIPRQELRDAARAQIGDTGLLDFTLNSLNNVRVGNDIAVRAVNPSTRVLEYTIHGLGNTVLGKQLLAPAPEAASEIYSDLVFLYTNVLLGYPELELDVLASRTVLDSKYYVKEWPLTDEGDQSLRLICRVMPSLTVLESEFKRELQLGELIVVPLDATVDVLKEAAQNALRDTYCSMDRFKVHEVEGVEVMKDGEMSFEGIPEVWVRGTGMDFRSELMYEGGATNWIVRCDCGALDDDGERMVACDICEVWQHTRCNGISCVDPIPELFMCSRCSSSLCQPREPGFHFDCSELSSSLPRPPAAELVMDLL